MQFVNNTGPCRTCLREEKVSIEIFQEKETSLLQMLTSFTYLEYVQGDGLPQKVCSECRNQIINCYNFKMLCHNTDTTLRELASDNLKEKDSINSSVFAGEATIETEETGYEETDLLEESTFSDIKPGNSNIRKSGSVRKTPYKCSLCVKAFRRESEVRRHETKHDPGKPYRCMVGGCRWSFSSLCALQQHSDVNHSPVGSAFTCRACGNTYHHARSLRQHLLTHSKPVRFQCQYCQKGFTLRHHVKAHERTHSLEKPFLCQQCGACFATKDRLQLHIKRHSDTRQHACSLCAKTFVCSYDLRVHARIHTEERAYMCAECGRQFRSKRSLVRHTRRHVETAASGDTFNGKNKTAEYPCNICKRNLLSAVALEKHNRTHTSGERSFKCETCSWMFTHGSHLRTHIARRHTSSITSATVQATSKTKKTRRANCKDTIIMSADGSVDRVPASRVVIGEGCAAAKPSRAIEVINVQAIKKPDYCAQP